MQSDDSVRIPLRARDGSIRAYLLIDAADADFVNQWTWSLGNDGYARRSEWVGRQKRSILLHRELLGLKHRDGLEGNHIDRDRLNCRRRNLRIASKPGNRQNRPSYRNATSQFRGVHWSKAAGKWTAQIKADGRRMHLGVFASEADAAEAARSARARLMPYAVD